MSARPAHLSVIRVFNETIGMDIFHVTDIFDEMYTMLGIIDYATLFHVVLRLLEQNSLHVLSVLHASWFVWAGPPKTCVLDRDPCFLGEFKRGCEFLLKVRPPRYMRRFPEPTHR